MGRGWCGRENFEKIENTENTATHCRFSRDFALNRVLDSWLLVRTIG